MDTKSASKPRAALSVNQYPTPPSLNLKQRQAMLSLAYLAYTGEGITTANPENTILANMNAAIPQIPALASGWKIVWGPAVYTIPGGLYQSNLMYVAQNGNSNQYAIAVRGTNFLSDVDWLLEDFDIVDLVPWPLGAATSNPAGAGISEATSIDMYTLLSLTDTINSQPTILQYLRGLTQNNGPVNLCVTGHSLGGLLSSTLALFLLENQIGGFRWDMSGKSTVTCITFAAPTAGNAQFAAYSDATFAAAFKSNTPPASVWDSNMNTNCDIVECNYDVAPLLYVSSNIYNTSGNGSAGPAFSIYGSNLDFNGNGFEFNVEWDAFGELVLKSLAGLAAAQNFTQLSVVNSGGQLSGIFNGPASTDEEFTDYLSAFMAQATWQHSNSYPNILGVTQLIDPSIIIRNIVSIDSMSVSSGDIGATVPIVITGMNFSMLGSPVVSVSGGYITASIQSVTDTQINATLMISSKAAANQVCSVSVSGSSGLNSLSSNGMVFQVLGTSLN